MPPLPLILSTLLETGVARSELDASVTSAAAGADADDGEGDSGSEGTSDAPSSFCCPITQDVMTHPVIAADGFTYEEEAILSWLRKSNLSPMTGSEMRHKQVIPNNNLRSMIAEWRDANKSGKGDDM